MQGPVTNSQPEIVTLSPNGRRRRPASAQRQGVTSQVFYTRQHPPPFPNRPFYQEVVIDPSRVPRLKRKLSPNDLKNTINKDIMDKKNLLVKTYNQLGQRRESTNETGIRATDIEQIKNLKNISVKEIQKAQAIALESILNLKEQTLEQIKQEGQKCVQQMPIKNFQHAKTNARETNNSAQDDQTKEMLAHIINSVDQIENQMKLLQEREQPINEVPILSVNSQGEQQHPNITEVQNQLFTINQQQTDFDKKLEKLTASINNLQSQIQDQLTQVKPNLIEPGVQNNNLVDKSVVNQQSKDQKQLISKVENLTKQFEDFIKTQDQNSQKNLASSKSNGTKNLRQTECSFDSQAANIQKKLDDILHYLKTGQHPPKVKPEQVKTPMQNSFGIRRTGNLLKGKKAQGVGNQVIKLPTNYKFDSDEQPPEANLVHFESYGSQGSFWKFKLKNGDEKIEFDFTGQPILNSIDLTDKKIQRVELYQDEFNLTGFRFFGVNNEELGRVGRCDEDLVDPAQLNLAAGEYLYGFIGKTLNGINPYFVEFEFLIKTPPAIIEVGHESEDQSNQINQEIQVTKNIRSAYDQN